MTWRPRRLGKLIPACLVSLACASGCTSLKEYVDNGFKVGPNYKRAAAPVANEWIDSQDSKLSTVQPDLRNWWTIFNDPVLDRLVNTAYTQNITLREAGFRIQEAQAMRAVVAGNLFPQDQAVLGGYTRTQTSQQSAFGAFAFPRFDNWQIGSSLTWELDFWGRFRRAIETADAQLDASIENFDDVLVILVGDVASSYVELRTLDRRLNVAKTNATLQSESVRVAQVRFDARAVNSELDTPQAKANLGNTLAVVEQLEIARRQVENRLCVLLGMPPHDLTYILEGERDIPVPPPSVAVGVPAELVWRRPDVRRAERLVAAQSAEIGFAESELYPHISINGQLSWSAAEFSDMFKTSAFGGSIGPQFRWNVLNYGRLLNNVRVHDARFQALVATYQQTILNANEEAENAIVAYRHYLNQVEVLDKSALEAADAERVAQIKYREGEIDFNRLFTVQQLLLSQQEALAAAQGNSAKSLVQLYKALGGGWELRLNNQAAVTVSVSSPTDWSEIPGDPVHVPLVEPVPVPAVKENE
ncbi:efflux transporter outer membrane subunit [Planctomicrobium sp. SH668]|uniref:efflux transporter outer membrane subunit n=1 Tax=Planctomicrobium sp. SH668 TaxID=3448126 RepID=UPI003F5AEBD6